MPANFEIAYPWVFFLLPLPLLVYWFMPALKMQECIAHASHLPESH
jgi:Ca-activated chloride channel family protein